MRPGGQIVNILFRWDRLREDSHEREAYSPACACCFRLDISRMEERGIEKVSRINGIGIIYVLAAR